MFTKWYIVWSLDLGHPAQAFTTIKSGWRTNLVI
jgi:hypothetical protein